MSLDSHTTNARDAARRDWDAVVIGAGHNGLVAALLLARAGLAVLVLERGQAIGGAARTERPFARAPSLAASTGAYLLGLVQPELLDRLGLELPLVRRDPHYFLPTTGQRHLLFGSDEARLARDFERFFSAQDYRAYRALAAEIGALRDDIAPTWLLDPEPIEVTAERYVRRELRDTFVELCRGSVSAYLKRFGFQSPLLEAMYAVTDGLPGCAGNFDTPGTGMNFLIHNMCRLPGSGGTWMLVRGGMGSVSAVLADGAARAGARFLLGSRAAQIDASSGHADGVVLESGERLRARVVMANCDPFTLRDLVGAARFPSEFNAELDAKKRLGSTLKINLALRALPTFRCLPEDRGQFGPTIHLLPEEDRVGVELEQALAAAARGELPDFPSIEWYVHSTLDPSLSGTPGLVSSALFVQSVPHEPLGSSWEREAEAYADHLLSICDRFAPGTSELVVDRMILHPKRIEEHFGMRFGHIHHLDNAFGFTDRFPHETPLEGLYSCSAGTHPGGSVIGSAGYIAARRALAKLGIPAPA